MATHIFQVHSDGTVTPQALRVQSGDVVEWHLPGPRTAIVAVDRTYDGGAVRRAHDPNDFTGPAVELVPGIHCLNNPKNVRHIHNRVIDATMPAWVWNEPGFDGVYIRLEWNEVNPAPGVFDWSTVTPHLERAVASGKYIGFSIKAGTQGTPDWIFDPRATLGYAARSVKLQGVKQTFGAPWDPNYQKWWFEVHKALAEHIASNNAWWQRFTSIRLSGANWHSAEARLPNRQIGEDGPDRPAQPDWKTWEQAGYTPQGMIDFYSRQATLFMELFPHKSICYPLIHNGMPSANADDPSNRPTGPDQVKAITDALREQLGNQLVVQHLGLQPLRDPPNTLPRSGSHPVISVRGVKVGDGNPNKWCLMNGIKGSPTAGQTNNDVVQRGGEYGLELALENAWRNSDYVWVEVYPKDVHASYNLGSGSIGPSGMSLREHADRFASWRAQRWDDELGPAFPTVHRHTFTFTPDGGTSLVQRHFFAVDGGTEVAGIVEVVP